jgi:Domain of unknown function (DUF1929)/Kelch motif/Galactose oxidase, central domain
MGVTNVPADNGQNIPGQTAAGQLGRRRFLVAGSAAALIGAPSARSLIGALPRHRRRSGPAREMAANPAATGSWTAPFNLTLVPIHAVMLHTGKVLLFSWPNETVGSDAVLWDPVSGKIINIALTYQRDIFCGGTSVLKDGRVFIAGGHIYQGALQPTQGVVNTTIFDPASNSWTEGPAMSQARWYPTATLLGDGTVIICGGTINTGASAITVDHYNPVSNSITRLPSTASRSMLTYPRMKLTTSGLLAWTNLPTTCYLNPATAKWTTGPELNSGSRSITDTSVLLPGLTTIMETGGTTASGVTGTAELLNLSARVPAWKYTASMHFPRLWANTVLLADGTLLVVGGGTTSYYGGPIRTAEIYNPATGTWTEMAAQTAPRMYHSTALLLPDGRVLSAGQSSGKYENTGEIFSPPYLFKGARPLISKAPGTLTYGQAFTVTTPQAASISHVALVKAATVTHSNNFDQRYVNCTFTSRGGALRVTSPPNANHAPPGWYMLFLVNSTGVPSVASWVKVN